MTTRLLELGTAMAAAVAAVLLGLMLAAPLLSRPASVAVPDATNAPSASAVVDAPPIGLYLQRGPIAFGSGPCMAVELTAESYPVALDAPEGTATVLAWDRTIVDPGNPEACSSRSGELHTFAATVTAVHEGDDPGGRLIGYALAFPLATEGTPSVSFEFTILARTSTQVLLQAVVTNPQGVEGLVFDRVDAVDPPFVAQPTPSPAAALEPVGSYLLAGALDDAGHCLVLDLGEEAYPDAPVLGAASARWWVRGSADVNDPAPCLTRSGDVHEVPVMVTTTILDVPVGYRFAFTIDDTATGADEVVIVVDLGRSSRDQLVGIVESGFVNPPVELDRVDSIDPPLATPSP
jgi:hypothetical protein